jgi:cytochrome c oxidase cbb3-type subunit 3
MSDHAASGPGGIDQPREHSFDGIEEYDNDLPLWWLAMLYLSVVAAVIYILHFHFGPPDLTGPDRLEHEIAVWKKDHAPPPGASDPYTEDQLRAFSKDPARGEVGKKLTTGKGLCFTCHTPDLTGLVGPNLRDEYWIYGSHMTDIVLTITKGHIERGMPPQEKNLTKDEIADLACYIVQLNRQGFKQSPIKKPDLTREKKAPIDY